MRSSLVVKASDCQCTSCNGPGFDSSIRRHSGIWGAADETVLNIVLNKREKNPPPQKKKIFTCLIFASLFTVLASRFISIFIFVSPFPSLHWSPSLLSPVSFSSHLPPHLNLQYLPFPPFVFGRYWLEMDFYLIQDGPLNKITKESSLPHKKSTNWRTELLISFTL